MNKHYHDKLARITQDMGDKARDTLDRLRGTTPKYGKLWKKLLNQAIAYNAAHARLILEFVEASK